MAIKSRLVSRGVPSAPGPPAMSPVRSPCDSTITAPIPRDGQAGLKRANPAPAASSARSGQGEGDQLFGDVRRRRSRRPRTACRRPCTSSARRSRSRAGRSRRGDGRWPCRKRRASARGCSGPRPVAGGRRAPGAGCSDTPAGRPAAASSSPGRSCASASRAAQGHSRAGEWPPLSPGWRRGAGEGLAAADRRAPAVLPGRHVDRDHAAPGRLEEWKALRARQVRRTSPRTGQRSPRWAGAA